jgi:hypothetical protein
MLSFPNSLPAAVEARDPDAVAATPAPDVLPPRPVTQPAGLGTAT